MTEETIHVWGYSEGCPACDKLKEILDLLGLPYQYHAIPRESPEREALRDAGFDTVPQVFTSDGAAMGGLLELRRAAIGGVSLWKDYRLSEGC